MLGVNCSSLFLGDALSELSEVNSEESDLLVHKCTIKSPVKSHFMTAVATFFKYSPVAYFRVVKADFRSAAWQ